MMNSELSREMFKHISSAVKKTGDKYLIYEMQTIEGEFLRMREELKRRESNGNK